MSSFWELTVTVCGGKEIQTHSRNRLYFQLSLPFFKNVKALGKTVIFYVIFPITRKRALGTFLITIERVTYNGKWREEGYDIDEFNLPEEEQNAQDDDYEESSQMHRRYM